MLRNLAVDKTESEKLFQEYLEQKGLILNQDFLYEPDLGKTTKIDFFVKSINTLFEVTEFSRDNEQDRRLLKTLDTKEAVGFDSYSLIRNKINGKKEQFRPYKKDYICVLVLHRGDSIVASLETELLAGAIFGDISIGFSNEGNYTTTFFGRNGSLKPAINTAFSAVAVIQKLFPDRKRAVSEFWKSNKKEDLANLNVAELERIFEDWSQKMGYDLNNRGVSLRVVQNPFASKQIPIEFFDGQLDEIFSIDSSGRFTQQK